MQVLVYCVLAVPRLESEVVNFEEFDFIFCERYVGRVLTLLSGDLRACVHFDRNDEP